MVGGSVYNDRFGGLPILGSSVPASQEVPAWSTTNKNLRFAAGGTSLVNWVLNTSILGTDTRLL